jgi:paraquat-inducible protein B
MSEEPQDTELPSARERQHRVSPFWILPVVAAGLVAYLGYRAIAEHGPTVTLRFDSANGLRVEQTQVMYKAVSLGTVREIELAEDAQHVVVHVAMEARAEPLLTDKTRFWVVRPRLSLRDVAAAETGLETLVSGAYIELDPGPKRGAKRTDFTGLERPPVVRSGEHGTTFLLQADNSRSLNVGSPIRHGDMSVGEVLDLELDERSGRASVRAFVREPYDRLVNAQTRFWAITGVDIGMSAKGLHIELASVQTLLSGGIEFADPLGTKNAPRAGSGHTFPLFESEAQASLELYGHTVPYLAYFAESVQGLSRGSPVNVLGMQVGLVTEVALARDPRPGAAPRSLARVGFVLQPERLSARAAETLEPPSVQAQVAQGLHVLLETTSYITGEKALTLDFLPKASAGTVHREGELWVLPSRVRSLGSITDSVSTLTTRLNAIPYEQIGQNVNHLLGSLDRTVGGADLQQAIRQVSATLTEVQGLASDARTGLAPAFERLPGIAERIDRAVDHANAALATVDGRDGELQRQAQHMLREVAEMARSVRLLADMLERKPEALLRGKAEVKP